MTGVVDATRLVCNKIRRRRKLILGFTLFVLGSFLVKYSGRSGVTSVLVLTYMRSGSSLTGDILQQAEGSFYLYEPLRMADYVRKRHMKPRPHMIDKELNLKLFLRLFTCELLKVPRYIWSDEAFMGFGKKTETFWSCLTSNLTSTLSLVLLKKCLPNFVDACLKSRVRIIKTIRMDMESAATLMDKLPDLKVIHLIRDPRPTLLSQNLSRDLIENTTKQFCDTVEKDILVGDEISQRFPGRIKIFFYEDLALQPIQTAKKLYDFVGTTFTDDIRDYVFNITMAGRNDSCAICTTRSNSSAHVDAWRSKMDKGFINLVETKCNYALTRFKYDFVGP